MSVTSHDYWDHIAGDYQQQTHISCADLHYGPLIAADRRLRLFPESVEGKDCLELGCGAGQNSIVLASRGARCVAVDLSARQLEAGRDLARQHGVRVTFVQADLQDLPFDSDERFDLVHSAYALPFVADQAGCIRRAARLLRPGGMLLLSTAHPLAAGEWVWLDDAEGMFLPNYFSPPEDRRQTESGALAVCRAAPLSDVFSWLVDAGLTVDRFLEPKALPVNEMSAEQRDREVPYWSRAWLECADQLERIPFVAIFRAYKPAT